MVRCWCRDFARLRQTAGKGQRTTDSGPRTTEMADFIPPRTLKGFRDYPPELMIPRERLLEQA